MKTFLKWLHGSHAFMCTPEIFKIKIVILLSLAFQWDTETKAWLLKCGRTWFPSLLALKRRHPMGISLPKYLELKGYKMMKLKS